MLDSKYHEHNQKNTKFHNCLDCKLNWTLASAFGHSHSINVLARITLFAKCRFVKCNFPNSLICYFLFNWCIQILQVISLIHVDVNAHVHVLRDFHP